jgi:hypothetical protein
MMAPRSYLKPLNAPAPFGVPSARLAASMTAFRPAALSLLLLREGAVNEGDPACFLAAAHLFR